jgi:hypothetical protein
LANSFLGRLLEQPGDNEQQVLALLERIDNELSMAADNETQKSVSFKQAKSENASLKNGQKYACIFLKIMARVLNIIGSKIRVSSLEKISISVER